MHVQAQAPKIEDLFLKNKILIEKMSKNILQFFAEKQLEITEGYFYCYCCNYFCWTALVKKNWEYSEFSA